jgi:hypothetical protein
MKETYIVEIQTAAGRLTVGTFQTLQEAVSYAGRHGMVVPVFPATVSVLALLEAPNTDKLAQLLGL